MGTSRTRENQTNQLNKSVFLFHKYGIKPNGNKIIDIEDDAGEIGKLMAQKVAKKLKLNLNV